MQKLGLVIGRAAQNLRTEMRFGIDRHDEVRKLHSWVGAIKLSAHILQLQRRSLCGEPPDFDLGTVKSELSALHSLTHAFEAVLRWLAVARRCANSRTF